MLSLENKIISEKREKIIKQINYSLIDSRVIRQKNFNKRKIIIVIKAHEDDIKIGLLKIINDFLKILEISINMLLEA